MTPHNTIWLSSPVTGALLTFPSFVDFCIALGDETGVASSSATTYGENPETRTTI